MLGNIKRSLFGRLRAYLFAFSSDIWNFWAKIIIFSTCMKVNIFSLFPTPYRNILQYIDVQSIFTIISSHIQHHFSYCCNTVKTLFVVANTTVQYVLVWIQVFNLQRNLFSQSKWNDVFKQYNSCNIM